jgi:hypothetical protein
MKQVAFRASCVIFFLVGLVLARNSFSHDDVFASSPFSVTFATGVLTLGAIFVIAILAGGAILRDYDHKMDGLIFTTRISHFQYVVSRFIGLYNASLMVVASGVLGVFVERLLPGALYGAGEVLRPWPYLWSLLVFAAPNVLLGTSLIFTTAALTRNSMATYVSGVFLYILYCVGSIVGGSPLIVSSNIATPEHARVASVMEPYGLAAYMEVTRYWTVIQKNTAYMAMEGSFLLNRLLWVGFALLLFAVAYRFFSFRVLAKSQNKTDKTRSDAAVATVAYRPIAPAQSGMGWQFAAFVSQTKLCFRTLIFSFPTYAFALLWTFFYLLSMNDQLTTGDFGRPFHPLTSLIVPDMIAPLLRLGFIMVVFYAAELMWQERKTGMAGLIDATPSPAIVLWGAKLAALCGVIVSLTTYSIILSVLYQISKGYFEFEWLLYADVFWRAGVPLVLLAILALFFQVIIPNKYAGMVGGFSFIILFSGIGGGLVKSLTHPMLRYAFTPKPRYSSMSGGSYAGDAANWFLFFWITVAILIAYVSLRLWPRGTASLQLKAGTKAGRILAISAVVAFISVGSATYYRTNIVHPRPSREQRMDWAEAYERAYSQHHNVPNPTYVDVKLAMDVYPSQRSYEINGTMGFENQTDAAMEQVLVNSSMEVSEQELSIDGATLEKYDAEFGMYWFRFDTPLAPGASSVLNLDMTVVRSGFQRLNYENFTLERASYMEIDKVLPNWGYDPSLIIGDPEDRLERDLPKAEAFPIWDGHSHESRSKVTFEIVVSTSHGQTVIAPGYMQDSWQEGERAYFQYGIDKLIPYAFGIASAVYESRQLDADGIPVTVYHHPGHDFNVDESLQASKDALSYYSEQFGPFPYTELKIAEIPAFGDRSAGTAYPATIYGVENRGWVADNANDTMHLTDRRVAHEIGHMWWGKELTPHYVEGYRALTEVLCEYCEMVVSEKSNGRASVMEATAAYVSQYFFLRSFEEVAERPISKVLNQPHIYYFKGSHVVHVLREMLGEETINGVLREMLSDFAYPKNPVAEDLISRLLAVAPQEHHARIDELFNQVVTYELGVTGVSLLSRTDQLSEVQATLAGTKRSVDPEGKEHVSVIADWVDVGFYRDGELVQMEKVRLDEESLTTIFNVKGQPDSMRIDPNRLRLEQEVQNNTASIVKL